MRDALTPFTRATSTDLADTGYVAELKRATYVDSMQLAIGVRKAALSVFPPAYIVTPDARAVAEALVTAALKTALQDVRPDMTADDVLVAIRELDRRSLRLKDGR